MHLNFPSCTFALEKKNVIYSLIFICILKYDSLRLFRENVYINYTLEKNLKYNDKYKFAQFFTSI